MAWCFLNETASYAKQVRDQLRHYEASVPMLWPIEVANTLCVAERRKRINKYESLRFKILLNELPISLDNETANKALEDTLDIARDINITVYDATYLELALRNNLPIATLDKKLQKAAQHIGIDLL
jgi:predicted nucleic acid-binding protein